MLVVSRKLGESVMIGPNIRVTLLSIGYGLQAKLGIEAPLHIQIERDDCRDRTPKQQGVKPGKGDGC